MDIGKPAALAVIVVIAVVVVIVVAMGISQWRHRVNPQIVNQPPAAAPAVPH